MPKKMDAPPRSKTTRGLALVHALHQKMSQDGLLQKEAAALLNISPTHLSDVLTGSRWSGTLGKDTLDKMAEFLGLPVISVFMMAEILAPTDFFLKTTIDERVNTVFEHMTQDTSLTGCTPSIEDWNAAPMSVRLLASVLYEQVSKTDLLGRAHILEISVSDERSEPDEGEALPPTEH